MRKSLILFSFILIMTIGLVACGGSGAIEGKWDDGMFVTEFKKGDIYIDEMGDEAIGTYKKLSGDKYEVSMMGVELEYEMTVDGDELIMIELETGNEDVLKRVK